MELIRQFFSIKMREWKTVDINYYVEWDEHCERSKMTEERSMTLVTEATSKSKLGDCENCVKNPIKVA